MPRQLYVQRSKHDLFAFLRSKHTVELLRALQVTGRFRQLQRELGVSSKTLSKRLAEFVDRGLVTRTIFAEVPLRVEYEMTDAGRELLVIVDAMDEWQERWLV